MILRSDHIHVSHEIDGDSLFQCIHLITAPGTLHEFDERAYVLSSSAAMMAATLP